MGAGEAWEPSEEEGGSGVREVIMVEIMERSPAEEVGSTDSLLMTSDEEEEVVTDAEREGDAEAEESAGESGVPEVFRVAAILVEEEEGWLWPPEPAGVDSTSSSSSSSFSSSSSWWP